MPKASDNVFTRFLISEGGSTSTPAAGRVTVYAKADGLLYSKDDAGTETLVSGGAGGGSVATDAIWDAKGDLAGGTGANTAAKLTAGANGLSLVTASGETTGLKWGYPAFVGVRVKETGAQTIADDTLTALTWNDADQIDTAAFHDTSSNTSRFTVPSGLGGTYMIGANNIFTANGTGQRMLMLTLNGATDIAVVGDLAGAGHHTRQHVSTIYALVATDYIEARVYQNSSGNLDTVVDRGAPNFWMYLIGA